MKQTAVLALSALVLAVSATVWIDVPAQRLTDSRLASLDQVIDIDLSSATLMLVLSEPITWSDRKCTQP